MSLPAILYHGTSTGYLDQIIADGLRPESAGPYLCYADDIEIARHHAEHMAEWDSSTLETECQPVIFAISIERFAKTAFCLDRNFIRLGPSAGRAAGEPLPRRKWTWYTLLKHAGSVGYCRTVQVTEGDIVADLPDATKMRGAA